MKKIFLSLALVFASSTLLALPAETITVKKVEVRVQDKNSSGFNLMGPINIENTKLSLKPVPKTGNIVSDEIRGVIKKEVMDGNNKISVEVRISKIYTPAMFGDAAKTAYVVLIYLNEEFMGNISVPTKEALKGLSLGSFKGPENNGVYPELFLEI